MTKSGYKRLSDMIGKHLFPIQLSDIVSTDHPSTSLVLASPLSLSHNDALPKPPAPFQRQYPSTATPYRSSGTHSECSPAGFGNKDTGPPTSFYDRLTASNNLPSTFPTSLSVSSEGKRTILLGDFSVRIRGGSSSILTTFVRPSD